MTEAHTTNPTLTDGDVEVWFERVGPARAKQLLETYKVDYRKYRPSYGEGLARDMASGHWNFDGAPLRIDRENNFFDGQHRLNAVILSDTIQNFLIISGLPVEAYNTADTGLARNYGDTLRRRGYSNVTMRTALVKLIDRWEQVYSLNDTRRRTTPELDAIHDKYVDTISRAVANALSTDRKVDMPPALVSFSWWLLSSIDLVQAKTFLLAVAEGENLRKGQPAYTLRERLRHDAEMPHTRNEYMHFVFQAWNAFRDGRDLERVALPSGLVSRENMAVPR